MAKAPRTSESTASPGGGSATPVLSPWLVSAWFDLPLLANLGWLVFCIPAVAASTAPMHLQFWQVYFLTTPHRWLTLWLVATDPDRRAGRDRLFLGIAVIAALIVVGTRLASGAFMCLALVDFVWNYWHYAAQHGGVLRMYARKAGGGRPRLETWSIRAFVFYAAMRLAGWSTGWTEEVPWAQTAVGVLDVAICMLPLMLLIVELVGWTRPRIGKLVYLSSVTGLYGGLLWALSTSQVALVTSLTMAAAVFHAVEYMAVVTHYAMRRQQQGSRSLFQQLARQWTLVLASFVVIWGLWAYLAESGSPELREFWLGANLWAAALHYAFDGLIWKLRRPQTAKALGVEITPPTSAAKVFGSQQALPSVVSAESV